MAILLIGLLTDFRGYLAAGQWLAPEMGSCCFCHADFADDADFFLLIILVPQISQIYTVFFIDYFSHGFTWIFSGSLLSLSFLLFFLSFLYFADFDLSVWKDNADFSNSLFFLVGNH